VAAQVDRLGVLMNAMEDRSANGLADNPDDNRLEECASWAGMSTRTMIRRFIAEIGFSFSEWRQHRLMRALELLASRYPSDDCRARSRIRDR
jgi:transcriptional regulator GlxA family with amidase domain